MKRTMLMLISFSLVACAMTPIGDCEGPGSPRKATLHYGDSELRVTPPVLKINKLSDFQLQLDASNARGPKGIDYSTLTVTVVGKPAIETGVDSSWIFSQSGEESDGPFIWCAPDPGKEPGEYTEFYYEITVADLGELDPRVNVRN